MPSNNTPSMIPRGSMDDVASQAGVKIWREEDDRSLIRLAPESIRKQMLLLPDDIRELDETAIRKRLRPSGTQNQLRMLFWIEYDRTQTTFDKQMLLGNCYRGGVSEETYLRYLLNPLVLAWIITPPTHYLVQMDALLDTGMRRMQEILEMDITDEYGNVNSKLANLVMKAFAYVDMRKNGAIAQKLEINQKSFSLNMKADAVDLQQAMIDGNMNEIDKKLKQLEYRERMLEKSLHPGPGSLSPLPDIEITESVVEIPNLVVEDMSEEEIRLANENASEV